MKPIQTTLPGVRDWREPQLCSAQTLPCLLTAAAAAGFEAIRLESWKQPFGYRVTFQRMPDASESRNARPAQFDGGNHFATKTEPPAAEAGSLPEKSKETLMRPN